jgi:hypothetical protein
VKILDFWKRGMSSMEFAWYYDKNESRNRTEFFTSLAMTVLPHDGLLGTIYSWVL